MEAIGKYNPWHAGSRTEGTEKDAKLWKRGPVRTALLVRWDEKHRAKAGMRGSKDSQYRLFSQKLA